MANCIEWSYVGGCACFRVHLEQKHLFLIEKTCSPLRQDIEYTGSSQTHLKPLKIVPSMRNRNCSLIGSKNTGTVVDIQGLPFYIYFILCSFTLFWFDLKIKAINKGQMSWCDREKNITSNQAHLPPFLKIFYQLFLHRYKAAYQTIANQENSLNRLPSLRQNDVILSV